MRGKYIIWLLVLVFNSQLLQAQKTVNIHFDFYGDSLDLAVSNSFVIPYDDAVNSGSVHSFYDKIAKADCKELVNGLQAFRKKHRLNDWIYYQLIRKTAQQIAPKADNYPRYTLYKWYLLCKSGYDARLVLNNNTIHFYVRSDETVYDIPYFKQDDKQYVCLNIHDYANMVFDPNAFYPVDITVPDAVNAFSYKVTQLPDFTPTAYTSKAIVFDYGNQQYHFNVMVNPEVQTIFKNYPVVDYSSYFNIPMSRETYSSLIPMLKKSVEGMKQKKGVDFLMRFTRNAFLYENDVKVFGKEKRFSPEQTLLSQYSDCDDRAALFFYLVKEIYNLPMIAVLYPTHITIAVGFDKPVGETITYNGRQYSICEPTPQAEDLKIGRIAPDHRYDNYQIAYAYQPTQQ